AAENSMGFHAPQEAARILGMAIDFARQGQVAVLGLGLSGQAAATPTAPEDTPTAAPTTKEATATTEKATPAPKTPPKAPAAAPSPVAPSTAPSPTLVPK